MQEWGRGSWTKEKTWALHGGHDKARSIIVKCERRGPYFKRDFLSMTGYSADAEQIALCSSIWLQGFFVNSTNYNVMIGSCTVKPECSVSKLEIKPNNGGEKKHNV